MSEIANHLPSSILELIDPIVSYTIILLQFGIVLIFFKKTRKFVTASFVITHLAIAIAPPYFGLIRAASYLFVLAYDGSIVKDLQDSIPDAQY